ncbi:MAG: 50S ribosomal protein L11 methyltransferase [Bacteroidia bacterium]|nr:50S ribosomal protein L11 methyltransferase [Bacteroidia bacterium]
MKTDYVSVSISAPETLREPVLALLAEIGYSAFEDTDTGLIAYVEAHLFDQEQLMATLDVFPKENIQMSITQIPATNWNSVWESNYPSVFIDHFCQIVPSFRAPEPGFSFTIKLDPKMSFGTGHHETTRLVIRSMENLSFRGKKVLDMGCGTGVLGILAAKMGAISVLGIDIDAWSFENTTENIQMNDISGMEVVQGDVSAIGGRLFDVILANINRNVLLADIPAYQQALAVGGTLVISGFYQRDEMPIRQRYESCNFYLANREEDNDWLALTLVNHQN